MKKKRFYVLLFLIILFTCIFIKPVKAYKCVYSGSKVEGTSIFNGYDGNLNIDINNGIPVASNFSDSFSQIITSSLFQSSMISTFGINGAESIPYTSFFTSHSFPNLPLDYISLYSKRKGVLARWKYEKISKQFNEEQVCPSEINISRAACFSNQTFNGDFFSYINGASSAQTVIFYYFNADIFDSFTKSEDGLYFFYVPISLLNNDKQPNIETLNETMKNSISNSKLKLCFFKYEDKASAVWSLNEDKSDGEKKSMIFACNYFDDNWDRDENKPLDEDKTIEATYKRYQKCLSKNKKDKTKCSYELNKYNKSLLKIQTWCKSVMDNRSYNSSCLRRCSNLSEDIYKLTCTKDDKGNCTDENTNNCNMSESIIAIIYNVLKWMKYIAPVLVIILSMIDFIKALASQDNDAMKKAQQKFVKRLISAVVLFLLPLIIDYVLRLFNLVDTSCDITGIFK